MEDLYLTENWLSINEMWWAVDNHYYMCQGRIQDFFKRGGAHIKGLQNFGACGDGEVWGGFAPSEAKKNCNFQSQFARFGAFFLPGAPTQSQASYLCKKKKGAHAGAPPSKPAPVCHICAKIF